MNLIQYNTGVCVPQKVLEFLEQKYIYYCSYIQSLDPGKSLSSGLNFTTNSVCLVMIEKDRNNWFSNCPRIFKQFASIKFDSMYYLSETLFPLLFNT